jgi:hypothetical protein
MSRRRTSFALLAFAIGALSDILIIRNGLSLSGPTLLDRYPTIWPAWLAAVFVSSLLLEFLHLRRAHADALELSRESDGLNSIFVPLAILLGMVVTHTALLIRDVIVDPTSHNLLPFEYLFWGGAVSVPAFVGSALARLLNRARP